LVGVILLTECHAAGVATNGTCLVYKNKTNNCDTHCGSCFNPGSRSGVMCRGTQPGYYCSSEAQSGNDMAYACMDWTFGSKAMQKAEAAFNSRTNDNVWFGIGTYGTGSDPQHGLGACYRMTVEGLEKQLLVQSINTGSDVAGNQFDLQIGDGGAGAYNTCAGAASAMYPGSTEPWGKQYGGVDNRADCSGLPKYPQKPDAMKAAGDDLITLCQYGFDKKVRHEGGGNPTLQDVQRVKCPMELVNFTWTLRNDEPASYKFGKRVEGFPNDDHKCEADIPGHGTAWCLTRMMDCRKPSGAFKDNMHADLMIAGMKLVQPCGQDGYTRYDVQCGCMDCYC